MRNLRFTSFFAGGKRIICRSILITIMALWAMPSFAQGRSDYFNVESPQVHPIEVLRMGGHDYLVAVNTRNSTVEIFDTDESAATRLLAVIRVGLEPVSVRYHFRLQRLYVANFLGDSISIIQLNGPSGPSSFSANLIETTWVGDEPMDISFYLAEIDNEEVETIFVNHMTLDGIGWRDALTLQPMRADTALTIAAVQTDLDLDLDGSIDDTVTRAVKEPRTVLVRDDQLLVLAGKGGDNDHDANGFDLDLYCGDAKNPFVGGSMMGGLWTSGFNIRFGANGELYAVGGEALNRKLFDEHNVRTAPSGFVKSMFYRIDQPCTENATVMRRDVNLEPGLAREPQPVKRGSALAMLTDVAIYHRFGEDVPTVFFTALGSDRVGFVRPDPATDAADWSVGVIDILPINGNPMAGPNGIVYKRPNPSMLNDPGFRVYVLNHLDNSITTIDAESQSVLPDAALSLSNDPRSENMIQGQRFLYDARRSVNGFNSCSSCHTYGRTDGLPWDLGAPEVEPEAIPDELIDGVEPQDFSRDKGFMVTQSLQGLLNFEVEPSQTEWVTNAPYHWRADRENLASFNGGFRSLLGARILTSTQLQQFEDFVNGIHYPPNPKQPRNRVPSGNIFVSDEIQENVSTGAFRGLKVFHLLPVTGSQRSCAMCHSLPEGSNNTITDPVDPPTESAALRGLFQKEGRRVENPGDDINQAPFTGYEGLAHIGTRSPNSPINNNFTSSINAFNQQFFFPALCEDGQTNCQNLQALNHFVHEFDWGAGPLIGCAVTVEPFASIEPVPVGGADCLQGCNNPDQTMSCLETQASMANNGVIVQARIANSSRGFWYDPTRNVYVPEGSQEAPIARTALLNGMVEGDKVVFQAVPLGDERRLATPPGVSVAPLVGSPPADVTLLPMVTNSFYAMVPTLAGHWATRPNHEERIVHSLHQLRLMQWGLIKDAASEGGFGFGNSLHNDAPRRFQVAASQIRHGATLLLHVHDDPTAGPVDPSGPLNQVETKVIELPIYPTSVKYGSDSLPVWQTAVEFEPKLYYQIMLGGVQAPGVQAVLDDIGIDFEFPMVEGTPVDEPLAGQFDPLNWNYIYVQVRNSDGSIANGGWQRLRLEPVPTIQMQMGAGMPRIKHKKK